MASLAAVVTSAGFPPPSLGRPHLGRVLTRVGASVLVAVIAPAALLWIALTFFNLTTAAIVALAWMSAAMLWRWATRRPASGLLLLALAVLVVRTAVALATNSAFLYFAQPVLADLVVALLFLGSLCRRRPIVARLAPDFYPMDATVAARPRVRALFRGLTLMWGLVVLLKAGITLTLLEILTTTDFVIVKSSAIAVLTVVTAVVTVVWSVVIGRREGLLGPR